MHKTQQIVTIVTILLLGSILPQARCAPPDDAQSGPAGALTAAGLQRHGFVWVSQLEAELQSQASALDQLRRAFDDALKEAAEFRTQQARRVQPVIEAIEQTRLEQVRLREQLSKGKLGEQARRQLAGELAVAGERIDQWTRQLAEFQGPASIRQANDLQRNVARAQAELAAAVLTAQQTSDEQVAASYVGFREQPDIMAALADLGDRHRLGPQRISYARERAKAAPLAKQVLVDELPIFRQGDRWCLTTLVAERTPAVFELALDSDFSVVSAEMLRTCGIEIPADARTISLAGADGPITGRWITLSSVRLGKHLIRNVRVIAPVGEAHGLPPQLGRTALAGLKLKIDRDALKCHLQQTERSPKP